MTSKTLIITGVYFLIHLYGRIWTYHRLTRRCFTCSGDVGTQKKIERSLSGRIIERFQPTGWTPLALAIRSAQQDLSAQSAAENIIYIVSDGIETCGGNAVKEAKTLHNSNVKAVVNMIGFDVNHAGQQTLQQVASLGRYP